MKRKLKWYEYVMIFPIALFVLNKVESQNEKENKEYKKFKKT